MHIALMTRENLQTWEVDDRPLVAALRDRGARVSEPIWSDPTVEWTAFDLAVPRTIWDYHERIGEFRRFLDRVDPLTRLVNSADTIRFNLDKRYLLELERLGVALSPTRLFDRAALPSADDIAATLRAFGATRGFLKPIVGGAASGTLRFDATPEGLQRAATHAHSFFAAQPDIDAMLLQPYLPAVETFGEVSLLYFGGELSHRVRKVPVPGDYRVMDDFGASDEPFRDDRFDAFAAHVLQVATTRLGARPEIARVDVLLREDGSPCITELELIEPSLFFRHDTAAADRLAARLCALASG